jgi:hypothetical protein
MKNKVATTSLLPLEIAERKARQFGIDLYNALLIEHLSKVPGTKYQSSLILKESFKNISGSSDFQIS